MLYFIPKYPFLPKCHRAHAPTVPIACKGGTGRERKASIINLQQLMSQDCKELICKDDPFADLRKTLRLERKARECPLTRQELGNYSWSVLHSFAAYYPDRPTQQDKESMLGLLKGYRNLYPCSHCRAHFQKDYDKDPPKVQNREELSLWVCRQHNNVNKLLGKRQFECSYDRLMQRWRTGCHQADSEL